MSISKQHIESSSEELRKSLTWFRSNPDLRRYCAISSMDVEKLRRIDRFIYEGLGQDADGVDEEEIRRLIDATLALERAVTSEILPVIKKGLTQRGPARNNESVTELRMTLDSIDPNTTRLVRQVCALRVAALSAANVA